MAYTPRPGDTQNAYGFWQDANGDLAPGQATPGVRDNPQATNYYDPAKGGLRYNLVNGQKVYQSDGRTSADPGGGAFHGVPHWNQRTGQFDVDLDWGKILSYAAGGGIGAEYAIPALTGGGGGGAAGGGAGATATGGGTASTAAGSGLLPSTTVPGSSVLGGSGLSGAGVAGGTSGAGMGGGMSFWDTLKTGYDWFNKGKSVYNTVTGHGPGPSVASSVGQTAGGIEDARRKALIDQALIQQRQDQLAQSRSQLALNAPAAEARNSVQGDILANAQDTQISGLPDYIHMGTVTGGLRPSMLSDSSRALGANMSRNALANNLSGKDVPDLTALPEAGTGDKILQGLAIGGGFWDALGGAGGHGASSPAPTSGTGGYNGDGTPGYPGDTTSQPNNPMPPEMPLIASTQPPPGGDPTAADYGRDVDPETLRWLAEHGGSI